jgi:hypothetical protein
MKHKKTKIQSETPVRDLPTSTVYNSGATRADETPLSKDDNWTTAHNDREEAHQIALNQEAEHYKTNHPHPEPKTEIFETHEKQARRKK